jgi:hypothetical protein
MSQTFEVQKKTEPGQKPVDAVQKKEKSPLSGMDFASQEKALAPGGDVHSQAQAGVAGGGQQMPFLDKIQASFGRHDVSGTKAHVGGDAKKASEGIGARAYATGNDVAFSDAPDLHTAAHEAAHVVQQRDGVQLKGGVGEVGDSYERQADAVADRVVQGKSAEDLLGSGSGQKSAVSGGVQKAVQRDAANTQAGALTAGQVASAITFNKGKNLKAEAWVQVAAVVGSSSKVVDATLVKAIAAWQAKMGLSADGKAGDITFGWLAQEPAGKGLENHVKSDNLLYVGLNPSSKNLEHNKLSGQGAKVTAVKGEAKQGHTKVGNETKDLGTDEGIKAFVDSLKGGLDDGKRQLLTGWLKSADYMATDEIAQLARALHTAECGQAIFTRAVLSGHSGGWSFWGDDNGEIRFEDLAIISKIFPKATGCVQDLCLSACNTGQSQKLAQYKAIFPNVKSIWAYVGYSPSAATGALTHIGTWEMATRGAHDEKKVDAGRDKIAKGSGKRDQNVATLAQGADGKESYKTSSPEAMQSYDTLKAVVDSGVGHFDKAYDQGLIDKQSLSVFYTNLQNLVGNFAYRLPDREKYETMLKKTLFLRYWENVTKKFMEGFGTKVKESYGSTAVPAFSGMARDKVLGLIGTHPNPSHEGGKLLTQYLKELDPAVIPATWA